MSGWRDWRDGSIDGHWLTIRPSWFVFWLVVALLIGALVGRSF